MIFRCLFLCLLAFGQVTFAQDLRGVTLDRSYASSTGQPTNGRVMTYINPILAGDHPDPTLLKVGNDFYMCGSSFHFIPNLPILHSKDLLHWETVSRVIPAGWSGMKKDVPGAGIWQGAITYFYGKYRIYFANNSGGGQFRSEADSPSGPWSPPTKLKGNAQTGFDGYDNSVFVDDDGTPYLLIKGGQFRNRIQRLNPEGNLTGELINMDWVNSNKRYSWAEGPVMCKRAGWYYYFVAGNVSGGQYVLRSRELSGDSTKWEKQGSVFAFAPGNPFPGANHMSSPLQLADGSWWCLVQSYERSGADDWSGQGRQDLLCRIEWDEQGKPYGRLGANLPNSRPDLPIDGTAWKLPRSDNFDDSSTLRLQWHFLNTKSAKCYSLLTKPGWLSIDPGNEKSHLLQKESGHFYTMLTKVANDPDRAGEEGGLCITRGDDSLNVRLCSGYSDGKRKIFFVFKEQLFAHEYTDTGPVWLKLDRREHQLRGYFSANGVDWSELGHGIDARTLDAAQPHFNSWVGNSIGLYAQGKPAAFDFFMYKDGYSALPLIGYNNYYGIETAGKSPEKVVCEDTGQGGWLMLGGVDLGYAKKKPGQVEIIASSGFEGSLELWTDDLGNKGRKIAVITAQPGKSDTGWRILRAPVKYDITGQHDLYIKIAPGAVNCILKSVRFLQKSLYD